MVSFRYLVAVAAAIIPVVSAVRIVVSTSTSDDLVIHAGTLIRDNYIVLMKENLTDSAIEDHRTWAASLRDRHLNRRDDKMMADIKYNYNVGTLRGYSGTFDSAAIQEVIALSHSLHSTTQAHFTDSNAD